MLVPQLGTGSNNACTGNLGEQGRKIIHDGQSDKAIGEEFKVKIHGGYPIQRQAVPIRSIGRTYVWCRRFFDFPLFVGADAKTRFGGRAG